MRESGTVGTLDARTTTQTSTSGGSTITLVNETEGWRAVLSRTTGFAPLGAFGAPIVATAAAQAARPRSGSGTRTKAIIGVVVAVIVLAAIGAVAGAKPTPTLPSALGGASSPTPAGASVAPSVAPSAAPSVAPSAAPSTVPSAAFNPIHLSGKGAKVPKFTIPGDAAAIATISATGSDNFAVTSLAADGTQNDLLVNVIGNYAGTVFFDAQTGQHSVAFSSARTCDGASKLTGKGDDVVQVIPQSLGLVTLNITNKGQDNFVVMGYSDNGTDLMVNEIGNYSGQVPLADGSFLLGVQSDGAWTVAPGS